MFGDYLCAGIPFGLCEDPAYLLAVDYKITRDSADFINVSLESVPEDWYKRFWVIFGR